ncbi:type VI secretion system baseplate subunit TssE [Alkalilimnicola sp. S0819]|uniref:type VI secretion system baseplate subunit TssE n=1 Tax=Alkalilimnicola sp. S0819 TaxID=2613922 RepID=UPI001262131B|nr:type VI secretion system baseplate subunit TssE [Alkalilimnicola sp. S0819]KAB7622591.1 type VI secretion system baseplate subunit TssE [Alkalilimnicola sp. S0819]MPQ17481.1 type VI secretion system baseplate subunit TssE [Alkalilimnicola sp. S0819]
MSPTDRPRGPQASLLDRLCAEQTENLSPPDAAQSLAACREALRRDLENLLNTRRPHPVAPSSHAELQHSLLGYGLPDFGSVRLGNHEERERFRQAVQDLIERCESRLRDVRVLIDPVGEEHERTLYLKISALLLAEPEPLRLRFDSRLRGPDQDINLREPAHG